MLTTRGREPDEQQSVRQQASASDAQPDIEIWGGVECTVNRVGDQFHDQVRRTGHQDRPGDIALLASTGVRAVRYPIVWERVAPEGLEQADWSWTDDRLARLRAHGLTPIAGLVHHGSGPACTSLIDPGFPELLATYARAVAERYPWIDRYTPVNEPLTTARFSALYGHWYPHRKTTRAFVAALLNQVRGTVLAMQAIRDVNPAAALIQTEDAGRTFSTPLLAYQARFENHRRWLTTDLLTGRVTTDHRLWRWLLRHGASARDLEWLAAHACPPDVIGLNYYFTSDRYLDEAVEHYPLWSHGPNAGNGRHKYADVEVVRVHGGTIAGHERVLLDAWERYGLPVAITEVHAGCSRIDQLRWTLRAWDGARRAREAGADVRAVTLWAMFGSVDWNSLCLRCDGVYEPGTFDVRTDPPRATALRALAQTLASGGPVDPLLRQPGWWERPERALWGAPTASTPSRPVPTRPAVRPILIAGSRGPLARALQAVCADRGLPAIALGRDRLDVTDPRSIRATMDQLRPWCVINAASHVRVDAAERAADACLRLNADAPAALAAACAEAAARFVTFSSDLVFDGRQRHPYLETHRPLPLNVYGISKMEGESRVREVLPAALIIRSGAFFGPDDDFNFLTVALRTLATGQPVRAACDTIVSPTYLPDLVEATLDLLVDDEKGVWHLANCGEISWSNFAETAADQAGLDRSLIIGVPMRVLDLPAPRPAYSALGSSRGAVLPSLEHALARYIDATRERRASNAVPLELTGSLARVHVPARSELLLSRRFADRSPTFPLDDSAGQVTLDGHQN